MKAKFCLFIILLISLIGINQVKADTIHYQMSPLPQPVINLCVDTNNFPVFILHKPIGFGTTIWNVEGVFYGMKDSIIFVPTSIGMYVVGASYDFNSAMLGISLFSQAPSHVQFEILGPGGGIINTTNDTLSICSSNGVNLGALGSTGVNTQYTQWRGPGFISDENPILINSTGLITFNQGNSCGVTIDSIEIIRLPTQLPSIDNVLLCNEAVDVILDAGSGWTYQWNTGANTQSIHTDTAGVFTVNLQNVCTSGGQVTVVVEQQIYPIPDLDLYSTNTNTELCYDQVAILTPHDTFIYDEYKWYIDDIIISTNQTLQADYELGTNPYLLEVKKGNCISQSNTIVLFYSDPIPTMMCVATFDPELGINKVVFQRYSAPYVEEVILCYKQGDNWIHLDTITTDTNIYTLYDRINNPNLQSIKYTVLAKHNCGNLSEIVDWHKTIKIGIVQEVGSGNYILQIMDDYSTLSGYSPTSYTIWMDELNDGNFTEIGSLNEGNRAFTIENPIAGASYFASVDLPWTCNGAKSTTKTYSNKSLFNPLGIEQINKPEINVFPNPSSGIFQIEGEVSYIKVFNNLGKLILSNKNVTTIDLTNFGKGMYYAKIQTVNGSSVVKLVVN
ncbi:MAG: T9SS type A sorting domain-containing protein [Bacteroidales bacterium]